MKYVIITGATGVLGKCYSKAQASLGENLILIGRSQEKLSALKDELTTVNSSIDIKLFSCDLSKTDDVLMLTKTLSKEDFEIKRLINVAGVDTQMAFEKYTYDKAIFQMNVNFQSVICITKYALTNNSIDLEILTVSSLCGATPMPYFALYSATKCALINFFDSIRFEYKNTKVKITTLMPGSIPTRPDIIADIKKQGLTGRLSKKSPEYVVKSSLKALSKNKRHIVPGAYNKFVYFLSKITPYKLQSKIIARKFSQKQKDAF